MEVSEVRVRLVDNANDRLKAVCTVTFDETFVVRDVKIVEGSHGLFVAMPSRKLSTSCQKCHGQNHLRARFCNECGSKLPPARIPADDNGREKAHRDVAHPIVAAFRQTLQEAVLQAYEAEYADTEIEDDVEPPVEQETDSKPVEDGDKTWSHDKEEKETQDSEKSTPSVSEYDSLIADLRGGDGRPSGGGRGSSRDRKPVETSSGKSSRERSDRDYTAPERAAQRDVSRKAPVSNQRDSQPVEPQLVPSTERGFGSGVTDEDDGKGFGTGLMEPVQESTVTSTVSNEHTPSEQDAMAPPPGFEHVVGGSEEVKGSDSLDDTSAFGAGIG